ALLTGFAATLTGLCAIEFACGKRQVIKKKSKRNVKPQLEKYSPWLQQQNFEDLEIVSEDGLKLKAKFLKAERE
ncbi:MAG: alpha/beta hydrolase, partial [Coprobacillus sp.]